MSDPIFLVERRRVLAGGLSGGLALGLAAAAGPLRAAEVGGAGAPQPSAPRLNAFVEVHPDGRVIIVTPGSEMGQGVSSSLPKIVAEEMDADWARVETQLSGANAAFANPGKRQRSANSDAVTSYFEPLRRVGASARAMLVGAAAARWGVPEGEVAAAAGVLTHTPSGRTLGFGEVAADAATRSVPASEALRLKNPDAFVLLGKSSPRKDIPAKVDGSAVFGMDVVLPGMVYAAVRHLPQLGATIGSFDPAPAQAMAGVKKVVQLDDVTVGVIARSYWEAQAGADALVLEPAPGARVDGEVLRNEILAGLDASDRALPFPVAFEGRKVVDSDPAEAVEAALATAPVRLDLDYEVPYLAHAAMEPLCATVHLEPGRCRIWAPLQAADTIPPEVAKITGLLPEQVHLERTYLGGGFGRKNERDFVHEAVRLAMAVPGTPVMLIWSRAEDMKRDYYRPAYAARYRAGVAKDGAILALHGRVSGQALMTMKAFRQPGYADGSAAGGLVPDAYAIAKRRIDGVEIDAPIRTGYWRSVSLSQNGFFAESAIDEIAAKLKRDPLDYRLQLTAHDPRSQNVLRLAAEKAGWAKKLPKGKGRGIALSTGWNSRCAQVVEVSVTGKALVVDRVVCAFDCGVQIDPDSIVSQMEGGILFGLSAALFGQITFEDGAVAQSTFADYPVVTLLNAPAIEVHLVKGFDGVGGVGEAGVPPLAPALAAAVQAATGTRMRRLPLIASGYEVAR